MNWFNCPYCTQHVDESEAGDGLTTREEACEGPAAAASIGDGASSDTKHKLLCATDGRLLACALMVY